MPALSPAEECGGGDPPPAEQPVLGAVDPDVPAPFGRRSLVRSVVADPVTALVVQRALVMEVAHPAVAAAVEQHSRFRARPLSRAWATADVAVRLTFGGDRTARQAVRQIYRVHDDINGPLASPARTVGSGDPAHAYTAHDASLLTWVWATLVDTAETAFTRWVRPFTPAEAETFYGEMRALGRFLGIPGPMLPRSRSDFAAYLEAMVGGDLLGSAPVCRAVARQVLWFRHWTVPPPLVRVERVLALATLDPRLSERLELRPSSADLALGRRLDDLLVAHYGRLPRIPPTSPNLYLLLRRPTIGLGRWARDLVSGL